MAVAASDSKAVTTADEQIATVERTIDTVMAEQEAERTDIAKSVVALRETADSLQQARITALGRVRDRRARISEAIRRMQLLDHEGERQEMELIANIRAGMVAAALAEGDLI